MDARRLGQHRPPFQSEQHSAHGDGARAGDRGAERPTRPGAPSRRDSGRRRSSPTKTNSSPARPRAEPMRSDDTRTRVEAGWSTARARPDWQVAYAYDRWRPTLFANVADDTDPWRGRRSAHARGQRRRAVPRPPRALVAVAARGAALVGRRVPLRRLGRGTAGALRIWRHRAHVRRALRAGWLLNDSRSYGYSISREDGWTATVTTELTREALGADGNGEAATVDVRGYLPVVAAARGARGAGRRRGGMG